MENTIHFLFHGPLTDFLPRAQPHGWFQVIVKGTPAVKDAIEALGVPHTEVGTIRRDGQEIGFKEKLTGNCQVEVYPVEPEGDNTRLPSLQKPVVRPVRFVADVHLGKLARYLRLLGFNTWYQNNATDQELARIALQDQRILLTRDIGLLKQKDLPWGYWLRSQHGQEQLLEVILRFSLRKDFEPFTRCMDCNGLLQEEAKEKIIDLLPPKTRLYYDTFYKCVGCQKIYWKGSHYENMERFIQDLPTES